MDFQKKLRRYNKNAAPVEGEVASSHLSGATVDLARRYMTPKEVRWMEIQLFLLHIRGRVEVMEEHRQLCFHIMVLRIKPVEIISYPTPELEIYENP
jgi:hypothetical protein